MSSKVHYLTWAESPQGADTALLRESARRQGVEVTVLESRGLLNKIPTLKTYLDRLSLQDIVLCSDGYDVLYVKPEKQILSTFRTFSSPIVFSGEKGSYHHLPASQQYFQSRFSEDPYPYLNSGLIMGRVEDMRVMLDQVWKGTSIVRDQFKSASGVVGFFNDQTVYGWYLSRHPSQAAIDTKGELFWTLGEEKSDVNKFARVTHQGIQNLEANTEPALVHVSHRRKFYRVYLYMAWCLGITLSRENVVTPLLDSSLKGVKENGHTDEFNLPLEFNTMLATLRQASPDNSENRKVAVMFIGTGKYIDFFQRYYQTCEALFITDTKKHYFVFTDRDDVSGLNAENITIVKTPHEPWPYSTLLRFRYINTQVQTLRHYSHGVYIDADMYIHSNISEDEFFSHGQPLFGVQHPGMFQGKRAPFEFNSRSNARVDPNGDLSVYWQGCFWGGEMKALLGMSKKLEKAIDDDLSRGVIAKWHDESHLNKYFIDNRSNVHTFNPGYAYPESLEGKVRATKKIVHIKKNHKAIRAHSKLEANEPVVADSKIYPQLKSLYTFQQLGDGGLIRDEHAGKAFKFNQTSAAVLGLCDGKISSDDIVAKMCQRFPQTNPKEIKNDVLALLNTFRDKGLIQ